MNRGLDLGAMSLLSQPGRNSLLYIIIPDQKIIDAKKRIHPELLAALFGVRFFKDTLSSTCVFHGWKRHMTV
jgi:hypothetical protein